MKKLSIGIRLTLWYLVLFAAGPTHFRHRHVVSRAAELLPHYRRYTKRTNRRSD